MLPASTPYLALSATSRGTKIRRSRHLRPYNRLIWAVCLLNGLVLGEILASEHATTATAFLGAGANITVAALIRQQLVINALFWLASRARPHLPLRLRWALAKVYSFGGIHVGAAISASVWYVAFLVIVFSGPESPLLSITAVLAAMILGAMLCTSLPGVRARHHNGFELTHRLGGWTLLLIFWVQAIALSPFDERSLAEVLLVPSPLWMLALTTASIVAPWLRLRRVAVHVITPSAHVAIAEFDYGVTPFAGSSTALSRNPLREWHSFANVPSPERTGFRLTISRAGDWTARFIDDPPRHIWVKGIPTAGVGNVDQMFRSVLWVATGSGIGPCLPHLLARTAPAKLLWATRDPRRTYGDELITEIRAAVPDALIWDSQENGKPDLLALAHEYAIASGVEAVICISNQRTTWSVVEGLEQRGVPAFGAIWDS